MSDDIQPVESEDLLEQAKALAEKIEVPEADLKAPVEKEIPPPAPVPAPVPEKPENCKRCGMKAGVEPLKPDEAEMREYVRRLISGQPYTKAFSLFDGNLTFVFRGLQQTDRDHMDALSTFIRQEFLDSLSAIERDLIQVFPPHVLSEELQIRVVFAVQALGERTFSVPARLDTTESISRTHVDKMLFIFRQQFVENQSEDMLALLVRTYDQFTLLCNSLMGAAFDENFYKGAGLG